MLHEDMEIARLVDELCALIDGRIDSADQRYKDRLRKSRGELSLLYSVVQEQPGGSLHRNPGVWSDEMVGWITPEGKFDPAALGKPRKNRTTEDIARIRAARKKFCHT